LPFGNYSALTVQTVGEKVHFCAPAWLRLRFR
jgi:hypothetical protein